MPAIIERRATLDGEPVFWLQADDNDEVPVLYVHGVPTHAGEWADFLTRTGGLAPDLPGFGRSGKRGDGDYTMHRYGPWLERFLQDRGVDRFRLVVHDWGSVGLMLAQRFPERVQRLVIVNATPLLPGYTWHRLARLWRTRFLGELSMGAVNRVTARFLLRGANVRPLPREWIDDLVAHADQGTQRAILRLFRSGDPQALAQAGAHLATLTCPTLVVWGERDPYFPAAFADAYTAAIPGARLLRLPDAGHWPWLDRPDLIETIAEFLRD